MLQTDHCSKAFFFSLSFAPSKNRIQTDTPIFACISMLANAVGQALTKHMHELLELMFATGLSEPLRQSLSDLSNCIPPLLPIIQGMYSS